MCLSELKCVFAFKIPGFYSVRSKCIPKESGRGGVVVLIKNYLWPCVIDMDARKDQLWFKLSCVPQTVFGAVYVSPSDSPYFTPQAFANIQEKGYEGNKVIIIGDFNARLGSLAHFNDASVCLEYMDNTDKITNDNGRSIRSLCHLLDLAPVNHAKTHDMQFEGNYTYKKGHKWISQLDWLFVSKPVLEAISHFRIRMDNQLKSDHAAMEASFILPNVLLDNIKDSAKLLGSHIVSSKPTGRKPLKYKGINKAQFVDLLPASNSVLLDEDIIKQTTDILYRTCTASVSPNVSVARGNGTLNRWQILLEENSPKKLWEAIGWKGSFDAPGGSLATPSNREFADHFGNLLNHTDNVIDITIPESMVYVPVLDDQISPGEIIDEIRRLKPHKAAGTDGVPPGILKWLPDDWIILLTFILNSVFFGTYPASWTFVKMFTIYKKGALSDPNNYRGISVINMLPKLYDGILNKRFISWYHPCPEQAGSQIGRGCAEQLLTLRLYIDIARKQKRTLYILFIDYKKAYDMLDRSKLLLMLCTQGCGNVFLNALGRSMMETQNVIGDQSFKSTTGIKQGSSISCSLFTFYLDHTVREVRKYGPDGFLRESHILLLMDDTALLATSRDAMYKKLRLLHASASNINMLVHPTKSQYMVVNACDREPFIIEDVIISYTDKYTYLGSPILNASVTAQVEEHVRNKQGHVLKYYSFIHKNISAPYEVKQKVLHAAVNSALLYACESWLSNSWKCVETVFLKCCKFLLGVRNQTPSDLVYIETGFTPISMVIRTKQRNFLKKLFDRVDYHELPVGIALNQAVEARSPMGKCYVDLMSDREHQVLSLNGIIQRVSSAVATRMVTYTSINQAFTVHPVYNCIHMPETARISFSRIRLASHHLHIETGRWSRTPRDNRTCVCDSGEVQTEAHVLLHCPLTEQLRQRHNLNYTSMHDLMSSDDHVALVNYCHAVLLQMNRN